MNFIPIIRSFHQKDFCLYDGSKILPWMSELTIEHYTFDNMGIQSHEMKRSLKGTGEQCQRVECKSAQL